jgi:hypothetical protein
MIEGYNRIEFSAKKLQKAAGKAFLENDVTLAEIRIALNSGGTMGIHIIQSPAEGKACEYFLGADGTRQFKEELNAAISASHELQQCVRHLGEIMVIHCLGKLLDDE